MLKLIPLCPLFHENSFATYGLVIFAVGREIDAVMQDNPDAAGHQVWW